MLRLLRISRPRFWIYSFGPYLVGALAGASHPEQFQSPLILIFGLFFLFPANLLIYGVNDIFDYETDRLNRKKMEYEALVRPDEHRGLRLVIAASCLPFAASLLWCPIRTWTAMAAFLFFSVFYSTPPIRAKARPVLDSAFNILYVCPGIFAYLLIGNRPLSAPLLLAGALWTAAMHAYSAVPDITADRESGLETIATRFGFTRTLWLCLILYLASALLVLPALRWLAILLAVVYTTLMALSLQGANESQLLRIYRWFPLVNTLAGMSIFFFLLHQKAWI